MAMNADILAGILDPLLKEIKALRARLEKLESSNHLQATSSTPSPASTSSGRSQTRKGQMIAPTSTPTNHSPTNLPNISTLTSKADFEKTVLTLSISDQQIGHVVGRAGTGLRQIHDFSHAKILVAPPPGTSGFRSVTIRGTAREVGDAVSAIGKRLAHRRVRTSKPKRKVIEMPANPKIVSPSLPECSPSPLITPSTPVVKVPSSNVPIPSYPTPSISERHTPKAPSNHSPSPMSISPYATPVSRSFESPMQIDAAANDYSRPGPVTSRTGLQTARRGGGYPAAYRSHLRH